MTDPIADMLTRIRNAQLAKKAELVVPYSVIKQTLAEILVKEGFLAMAKKTDDNYGEIKITLNYQDNEPSIRNLKRISKPGRRVYAKKEELPVVLGGQGIAIISTSQGLMTNKQAKKLGLGGEVLCEIY